MDEIWLEESDAGLDDAEEWHWRAAQADLELQLDPAYGDWLEFVEAQAHGNERQH